ncbi:MAG: uracil-DNA glycosylase family protein, partial [Pseudomonadota bacterium]
MPHLSARLRACRVCVERPLRGPLPHAPNPIFRIHRDARICIASQAAGARAHASSTPFLDPSGVRLREWMGIGHGEFYDASRISIVP